jgi:type II secretory pathway pseudopilin PulG
VVQQPVERSVIRDQRGITIIETTVILSVLFILAGVMSPIVGESVNTARAVKAKNDASMIAMGLINLQKDLGGDALSFGSDTSTFAGVFAAASAPAPASVSRLPDVLASAGEAPATEEAEEGGAVLQTSLLNLLSRPGNGSSGRREGNPAPSAQTVARQKWLAGMDSLDAHLRSNQRGYRFRRPGESGGWNGPYLSAELKGDPWGQQYVINTRWLDGGSTAADSQGRPRRAVFVVSPGGNGIIETPFEQPITDAKAFGDDIVIRIQ